MPLLREKSGRWSPQKIAAFAVAVLPACWLLGRVLLDDLGPRPVTAAIHFSGEWAVRLLLLSLAITPARRMFGWGKLINARRTLGVAVACYAVFHFLLYVTDQKFDLLKVASEIVLRFYLTIGFFALIGLIALGATSTDAAIRRLGSRWGALHSAAYLILMLAIVHFMLQKKLEIDEPTLMAGFAMWLLGYRLIHRFAGAVGLPQLVGLAIGSAVLTAALEAGWFAVKTGVDPRRVLEANLMFDVAIRPGWWVLAVTLALTAAYVASNVLRPKPEPTLRTARVSAR